MGLFCSKETVTVGVVVVLGVVKCINSRFHLTPDVKEVCLCRGIEKLISRALSRLSFR